MSDKELMRCDGARSGLADPDEELDSYAPETPAAVHPVFAGILAAHFGGTTTQIRTNNAAQAFGGKGGHFPGNHYGERGERR